MALKFADATAKLLKKHSSSTWLEIAQRLRVPFDATKNIHLEYDSYNGSMIKQADVVLLGFPLQYPMSAAIRRSDLVYYANRTDPCALMS